jgi:hypothetical protein
MASGLVHGAMVTAVYLIVEAQAKPCCASTTQRAATGFQQQAVLILAAELRATERQGLASERAANSQLRCSVSGAWLCSADAPGEQGPSDWGPRSARCRECGAALASVPPGQGLDSPLLISGPRRWSIAYCDIVASSQCLNEWNALDSTSRVGSRRAAALGRLLQDGVARDCWRLQHPRQN